MFPSSSRRAARRASRLALAALTLLLPVTVPSGPAAAAGFTASCPAAGYISQGYTPEHNGHRHRQRLRLPDLRGR
ncbi:hypothetical protein [Kitasatospora sp. NBC_00039]|uniref:hypothetical protein n=1 Tax=Kitasatospora sp. NBC_00039 TaxID=2903565 RepID=UPI003244EC4A